MLWRKEGKSAISTEECSSSTGLSVSFDYKYIKNVGFFRNSFIFSLRMKLKYHGGFVAHLCVSSVWEDCEESVNYKSVKKNPYFMWLCHWDNHFSLASRSCHSVLSSCIFLYKIIFLATADSYYMSSEHSWMVRVSQVSFFFFFFFFFGINSK